MSESPEALRLYVSIFEKPKRYRPGGILVPPMEIEKAAANALRLKAELMDRESPKFASQLPPVFARCEACGAELGHWPGCVMLERQRA